MASVSDAELQQMSQDDRAKALGMMTEQLTGRSMFIESVAFRPGEENYPTIMVCFSSKVIGVGDYTGADTTR